MKNYLLIFYFLLLSVGVFAQTIVKLKIQQADPIELNANGEPLRVGDSSKFEVKGGTFNSLVPEYTWEETSDKAGYTHKVIVKDNNNCTVSIYINVKNTSGIEELSVQQNAYPNPTTDIVNIPLHSTDKNELILIVINEDGKVIFKTSVKANNENYPLSLASCNAGRYFIQVVSGETKTYSVIKK